MIILGDSFGTTPVDQGKDSGTLPMPARFIVDQNSIIRAADVNPDYTVRQKSWDTVEKLKAIASG